MKNKLYIGIAIVAVCVFFSSVFVVDQTETAIVLQFKKPMRAVKEPGLEFKFPWEDVVYFDKRILDYDATAKTVIAGDLKRLEVDAYVKYRINNPFKFLETVKSQANLE